MPRKPSAYSPDALAPRAPVPAWSAGRRYGIVIDAGSSGSRLQVYSWKEDEVEREERRRKGETLRALPRVEKGIVHGDDWQMKVEPGISTFGASPTSVGAYLRPLFDHALSIIPAASVPSTPVYLLATAGMRLLPLEQQRAVLAEACGFIRNNYAFYLPDCSDNVKVISGEDEGLYGWVAINYLLDGFHNNQVGVTSSGTTTTAGTSTYGFLDMGGASTQIAFEPGPQARIEHEENLINVKFKMLDGSEVVHPVFVTTWLRFGTNKARERYVQAKIKAHPPSPSSGSSSSNQTGAGASAETGAGEKAVMTIDDPCLPKGLVLSEKAQGDTPYVLVGTGSFSSCVRTTTPLLEKDAYCANPPCLFAGVHVPPIDFDVSHFIGVSEYWYSSNDIFGLGGIYDYVEFEKAAEKFCAREWTDLKADFDGGVTWGKGIDMGRLEMQCFKAAWIVNVLHEGLGLPRLIDPGGTGDGRNHTDQAVDKAEQKALLSSKPGFQSVNEVNGLAISWTLGKMVLEASRAVQAPSWHLSDATSGLGSQLDKFRPAGKGVARSPFLFLLLALALVTCVWSCIGGRGAKRRRKAIVDWMPSALAFGSRWERNDYVLANLEDGEDEASTGAPSAHSSFSLSSAAGRAGSLSMPSSPTLSRFLLPLRRLALRLTSSVRSQSRRASMPRLAHVGGAFGHSRPALRQTRSSPSLVEFGEGDPIGPTDTSSEQATPTVYAAPLPHHASSSVVHVLSQRRTDGSVTPTLSSRGSNSSSPAPQISTFASAYAYANGSALSQPPTRSVSPAGGMPTTMRSSTTVGVGGGGGGMAPATSAWMNKSVSNPSGSRRSAGGGGGRVKRDSNAYVPDDHRFAVGGNVDEAGFEEAPLRSTSSSPVQGRSSSSCSHGKSAQHHHYLHHRPPNLLFTHSPGGAASPAPPVIDPPESPIPPPTMDRDRPSSVAQSSAMSRSSSAVNLSTLVGRTGRSSAGAGAGASGAWVGLGIGAGAGTGVGSGSAQNLMGTDDEAD